ncbi:DgyrCDS7613 [Dimorphilus gyrociliatus]|uniref:DgyrCDS7613 n=1 Tax=Dimorphilus gyrociliatus TaxID=2664684 RepID=A0A7I8VRI3_9ANNE|nr:DgyrCDS7613 [Dimorphilus gyrociliatus]
MISENIVAFRNPAEIWQENWTFLIKESVTIVGALLTLFHAFKSGGRNLWLWVTCILHGVAVEIYSYELKDIDNFWHIQGTVMFFKKRFPLYIVCLYPYFIYTATMAVKRMRLPRWSESLAVGLAVVCIDLPYDITGVKLLWWTWHDTDPNVYDRMYYVPWTSYIFHASFAFSFNTVFNGLPKLLNMTTKEGERSTFRKELTVSIATALFSFPMGVIQFVIFYHPLHDIWKVPTEVCCCLLLILGYCAIVWKNDKQTVGGSIKIDEIALVIFIHYTMYFFLNWFVQPEQLAATGLHEPLGDCSKDAPILSALGQMLPRKQYLCDKNYDEPFDFHCTQRPADGVKWYTICGTPFTNRVEHCVVVSCISAFGLFIFKELLGRREPKQKRN